MYYLASGLNEVTMDLSDTLQNSAEEIAGNVSVLPDQALNKYCGAA
jgi:hypothetical protein